MTVSNPGLSAGSVGTEQLANGSVTEAKLGALAVSAAKLGNPFTAAEPAGNNELKLGVAFPSRSIVSTYKGDAATVKVKVKHGFSTAAVHVQVYGESAKAIGAPLLNAAGAGNFTWTTLSAEEIEVTFGTAVGAAALAFIKVTD